MKKLINLLILLVGITSYSQINFSKATIKSDTDKKFEVHYKFASTPNKKGKCFTPKGGSSTTMYPMTLSSELRSNIREKVKKNTDKVKYEVLHTYVRKNDWVVIVEHKVKDRDCKDGFIKKREMMWFSRDKELTDEAIDKKVKSSVTYLWWKNDRYESYEVIERYQPYIDSTDEFSLIQEARNLLLKLFKKEERDKFSTKDKDACMCVRG